jgi:L-asparaginase/Glu-tRNA(Gln) amidotransferase subunit D
LPGNAPSKKSLYDALTEASQRGVVIVILSQCKVGLVTSFCFSEIYTFLRAGKI